MTPFFTYPSSYDAAIDAGLSQRAQAIFDYLGTNNFEGVMRLLADSHFVAHTYDLVNAGRSQMLDDLTTVKRALVQVVAQSHPAHTGTIPDAKKSAAATFIKPYHTFSQLTTTSSCIGPTFSLVIRLLIAMAFEPTPPILRFPL